jgi:hypothetical protein
MSDAEAIAAKYEVSRAWVHRLIQRRRETGSLAPRKQTKIRSRVPRLAAHVRPGQRVDGDGARAFMPDARTTSGIAATALLHESQNALQTVRIDSVSWQFLFRSGANGLCPMLRRGRKILRRPGAVHKPSVALAIRGLRVGQSAYCEE